MKDLENAIELYSRSCLKQCVEIIMHQKGNEPAKVAAYQCDGPSEFVVPDGQMQLF